MATFARENTVGRPLSSSEVRVLINQAFGQLDLAGKRLLTIIPDGTRTAPIALLCRLLEDIVKPQTAALDYLVALGTHRPMGDHALSALIGAQVCGGRVGDSRVFQHRADDRGSLIEFGLIPAAEIDTASQGLFAVDVPVRFNRLLLEYDHLLVCGPVFPHEVAGFSGGNKYFVPGVAGQGIIDVVHWLGALMTSAAVIGIPDNPVRTLIDRAAEYIPTPRHCLAMVMDDDSLRGLHIGEMEKAWRAAVDLSARINVVYVQRTFRRILSVVPKMYEDLWTAAKGMYKLEPIVADGGEVIIYAPHVDEISYSHGRILDEIGYHVRDYFVQQWDCFKHRPWGVLAHSTHLRGLGTYENGVEKPRIQVTLATGIPRARCEKVNLAYLDPDSLDPETWAQSQGEDALVTQRAGEKLYGLAGLPGRNCVP